MHIPVIRAEETDAHGSEHSACGLSRRARRQPAAAALAAGAPGPGTSGASWRGEAGLRAAEDRAAGENIALLRERRAWEIFTDGEVRRANYMTGILESTGGMSGGRVGPR